MCAPSRPMFPGAAARAGPRSVTGRPPQASRKGWPQKRYRKAAPGQPQGLALLYTNASAALRAAPVYSRGTPCGYPVPAAILYCRLSCTGGYLLRVPCTVGYPLRVSCTVGYPVPANTPCGYPVLSGILYRRIPLAGALYCRVPCTVGYPVPADTPCGYPVLSGTPRWRVTRVPYRD